MSGQDHRACEVGEHNFHTGKAPCSKCGLRARDVGVQKGVVTTKVTPVVRALSTNGAKMVHKVARGLAHMPNGSIESSEMLHARVAPSNAPESAIPDGIEPADYVPRHVYNRADEVARLWRLPSRRDGEDDDSIHARVRTFAAQHPGTRPSGPLPAHDWTPSDAGKIFAVQSPAMKRVN